MAWLNFEILSQAYPERRYYFSKVREGAKYHDEHLKINLYMEHG